MKLLVEGCSYDPKVLVGVLPEGRLMLTGEKVLVEHVGYFRSAACDDFVFFLPKVVLQPMKMPDGTTQDRVLCSQTCPLGLAPEDVIDLDKAIKDGKGIGEKERDFLYEFSVWIYRAIARYDETHKENIVVWRRKEKQSGGFRRKYVTHTLLDVILAMIRFNRDNQDYFTFRVKEKHSGFNKISWPRTIARTTAFIQDETPIYLETRNRKKVVNFDEELLVIFYSILNYVNRHFGFKAPINIGYELIPDAAFKRYLKGYGESRLRQIKYKYFSDRDLALWDLCFAFFNKMHKANVVAEDEEYLIAKNFEIIFEAMIDELLGDRELSKLKELDDGKEIDHLYLDESLTHNDGRKTFYIADSKYYKIGRALEGKSVAKQFTYAKDMLQLNLDLFLPGDYASDKVKRWRKPFEGKEVGQLRDPVTEGYDVIPNFFISARMDPSFDYASTGLAPITGDDVPQYFSIHYPNRLFDRDTLILQHYDLNFLYVVKLYGSNDSSLSAEWKRKVKVLFRDSIRKILADRFEFRAIMPHDGIDPSFFFKENLNATIGKVYSPYSDVDGKRVYMLATLKGEITDPYPKELVNDDGQRFYGEKIRDENEKLLDLIKSAFYVTEPLSLGENPSDQLKAKANASPVVHGSASDANTGVQVVSGVSGRIEQSVDKSSKCPCPVDQCPNPESVKVLVLPHTMGANLYRVVDGTLLKDVSASELDSMTSGAFSGVNFPSAPYHVWDVEKIS